MTEIICEIGKNFVTTPEPENEKTLLIKAKDLIKIASNCGAKIMKFQVHNVDDEVHPLAGMISPHFNQDRYEWVKRNTYSADFWWKIKEYCRELGVEFLATPMSRGAAEILNEEIGIDRWKIGSADILDLVMLDYIRDSGKPVILSSGMSTLEELKLSYDYLKEKTNNVSILHCVSKYPCELSDLNLATIPFLKKKFPGVRIGFSDHSLGLEGSLMAVSLGAEIIEKHFTLDRSFWGPDHKVSILPDDMERLINRIQMNILAEPTPEAYGVELKAIVDGEMQYRPTFRKGLYASQDMKEGGMLDLHDIISLRPQMAGSIGSENYPNFIGKTIKKDIIKDGGLSNETIA